MRPRRVAALVKNRAMRPARTAAAVAGSLATVSLLGRVARPRHLDGSGQRRRCAVRRLRHRDTAWFVEGGRSFALMTVDLGTRTRAGVKIGDPSESVKDHYRDLRPER